MTKRRMREERAFNSRAAEFSTTDAHGLTQMGGGFSTEGNKGNKGNGGSEASLSLEDGNEEEDEDESLANELESTPISDSGFIGSNGEGTEPEFSTADAHGLTQMGGGFSTEGNEGNKGDGGSGASLLLEDETEEEDEDESLANELESTPISDSDVTGSKGEGTEPEFSTTDGHGLTQMGGGFSTEGNEGDKGDGGSGASL
jgi:hypothetical protein